MSLASSCSAAPASTFVTELVFPPPFSYPSQTEGENTQQEINKLKKIKNFCVLQVALIQSELIFLTSRWAKRHTVLTTDKKRRLPPALQHSRALPPRCAAPEAQPPRHRLWDFPGKNADRRQAAGHCRKFPQPLSCTFRDVKHGL